MTADYPPLNFNQLRLFLAVAEHGGVRRAADAIYVSQPSVSQAVRELERDVGLPLLERRGRGVALTEAGRLLAEYARQIFALSAEARRAMEDLRGLEGGGLAVGASTTIGVYLLPGVMGRFHQRHPAVGLSLEIGNTEQVVQRLRAGQLDVGLVEGPVEAEDVRAVPFLDDHLVLVTAPEHPFATEGSIAPAALAAVPFLAREPGSGTRAVVEETLARHQIVPQIAMELGHTEAIKKAVAANLGVSILSRLTVEEELAAGTLAEVEIEGVAVTRAFRIVTRARSLPTRAAQAFLTLLHEE